MSERNRRFAWLVLAAAAVLPACSATGLAFRQDPRLQVISPRNLATISLPITLRWTVRDFTVRPPGGVANDSAGYFAVLVDVGPMPPGQDLRYFARKDEICLRTPGCPDQSYLRDRGVFLTTKTSFTIQGLADTRPRGRPSVKDAHEITIVLLDGKSQRIGESAYSIRVFVDRHRSQL